MAPGSAPLLLAGMVLGGARWLALRPVALRPADHWWIWRLVLSLAVGGLREVRLTAVDLVCGGPDLVTCGGGLQ